MFVGPCKLAFMKGNESSSETSKVRRRRRDRHAKLGDRWIVKSKKRQQMTLNSLAGPHDFTRGEWEKVQVQRTLGRRRLQKHERFRRPEISAQFVAV